MDQMTDKSDKRLLTRVRLRNYKSIAACDVSPAQLSFVALQEFVWVRGLWAPPWG